MNTNQTKTSHKRKNVNRDRPGSMQPRSVRTRPPMSVRWNNTERANTPRRYNSRNPSNNSSNQQSRKRFRKRSSP